MNKTKVKTILSLLLCLAMTVCLVFSSMCISASAVSQSEIDALKDQRDDLKSQQSDVQSTINALKSQQNTLVELKEALDAKNELTLKQIMNLEEQITLQDELIAQKTVEVEEAQQAADDQLVKLKARIRAMEENGKYNYLEVLFGANSISEFLSLIDDIRDIMQSDQDLQDAYQESIKELKAVKAEYEQAKLDMQDKQDELEELSDQLESDIAEASATISSLQGDINANAETLSSLSAQQSSLSDKISAMSKQLAEEAAARQAQQQSSSGSTTVVGSGNLVWPVNCYYISSRQGPRTHPITGEYKNHGGTDIAASYGSPIYAADSGKVVTSSDGWNGGWGNYVMIDHGNGMQTLYAHMSSRACSAGQTVSAGQVIGYVGSSGLSTGAHLHFEMYINGSKVDPQTYYPGLPYTYSPTA